MICGAIRGRNLPDPMSSTQARASRIILRLIISDRQIWLIAAGLIAVDLLVFMIPIVPVLAAYVLVARPAWFKEFIDDVYDRTGSH